MGQLGINDMKRILAAAAAALAGLAGPALADANSFYIGGFVGGDMPDDESLDGANAAGQLRDIDVALEEGTLFGLVLGVATPEQDFGRFRAEIEAGFRSSELEGLNLNGVARVVQPGSEVSVASGMLNVHYDTPVFLDRVRLNLGAGFGVAGIDHEIRYLVANGAAIGSTPGNLQIAIPSSEMTYAYQIIGGIEVMLAPGLSLTGDVRYFDLGDVQAERYILNSIINGVATTNGTLDSILDADYATTSLTIGVRVAF